MLAAPAVRVHIAAMPATDRLNPQASRSSQAASAMVVHYTCFPRTTNSAQHRYQARWVFRVTADPNRPGENWQPASKASNSASRGSVWSAVSKSRTVMHLE
jgi:hypothetical protein